MNKQELRREKINNDIAFKFLEIKVGCKTRSYQ